MKSRFTYQWCEGYIKEDFQGIPVTEALRALRWNHYGVTSNVAAHTALFPFPLMDDDTLLILGAAGAAGFALWNLSKTVDNVVSPLAGITSGAGTIGRETGETYGAIMDAVQGLLSGIGRQAEPAGTRAPAIFAPPSSPQNVPISLVTAAASPFTPSPSRGSLGLTASGAALSPHGQIRSPAQAPPLAGESRSLEQFYMYGYPSQWNMAKGTPDIVNRPPTSSTISASPPLREVHPEAAAAVVRSIVAQTGDAYQIMLQQQKKETPLSQLSAETKVKTDTFSSAAGRSSPSIQTVSATKSVTQPSVGLKVGSSYTSGSGATVSVKGYTPAKKSTKPRAR